MVCPKCGKEINEKTKFCDGCGEEIIQPPVVPKKKSKKKLIAIIVAVVVVLISIIAMTSGETSDNPNVIKSEVGSEAFGDVSFDITFDEFIELYNDCVYEDEEYDSVRQMRYLHKEDFEKQVNYEAQLIMYEKKFGTTYENLGALSIFVNSQNDKIQSMEWRCKAAESDYATEQAIINYHYTLPASFFSFVDDDIDFPYNKNSTSYAELFSEVLDKDDGLVIKGDSFYKLLYNENGIMSISFSAATDDSQYFESFANKTSF